MGLVYGRVVFLRPLLVDEPDDAGDGAVVGALPRIVVWVVVLACHDVSGRGRHAEFLREGLTVMLHTSVIVAGHPIVVGCPAPPLWGWTDLTLNMRVSDRDSSGNAEGPGVFAWGLPT